MPSILLNNGMECLIDHEDAWALGYLWNAHYTGGKQRRRGPYPSNAEKGLLHRAIMGYPEAFVDHKDGDTLNCRRSNLREATSTVNNRNIAGPRADSSTGYLGVYRHGKGFQAGIRVDGKLIMLGTYPTAEEAHEARLAGERKYWGIQPRRAHLHV